ncbi:unnamed protein product [Nezara viridula]|uniref:Uncharacterized protein n=1 Tax=Nezara viridula TaxID=85310 RepID=A0A9P0HK37_NEZVI|nr:unnamed protein product [Nezara viridula]
MLTGADLGNGRIGDNRLGEDGRGIRSIAMWKQERNIHSLRQNAHSFVESGWLRNPSSSVCFKCCHPMFCMLGLPASCRRHLYYISSNENSRS